MLILLCIDLVVFSIFFYSLAVMDPNEPYRAPTWHFRCSFIAYSAYAPRIAKKRAKRLDLAFLSVYVAYALTGRRIRYKNRQF